MPLKVLPYDDDLWLENGGPHNKTEYMLNRSNYGHFNFRPKEKPMNSWAVPFVTGHKYKIHWGEAGIDFEQMSITMSEEWRDTDSDIYLVHNWTDVRQAIDVKVRKDGGWETMPNNSIATNEADH